MSSFDVAVIGLGVMGSAALAALGRRGRRVVGIDRFVPGHDRGSSHGATRIIRLGYFEHPSYVPLLRAAYPLWRELEARSGESLMSVTGILEIGAPTSELVAGTLRASRLHGLAHEILDQRALAKRFPAFRVPEQTSSACSSRTAVLSGRSLRSMPCSAMPVTSGAELCREERVIDIRARRRPACA